MLNIPPLLFPELSLGMAWYLASTWVGNNFQSHHRIVHDWWYVSSQPHLRTVHFHAHTHSPQCNMNKIIIIKTLSKFYSFHKSSIEVFFLLCWWATLKKILESYWDGLTSFPLCTEELKLKMGMVGTYTSSFTYFIISQNVFVS